MSNRDHVGLDAKQMRLLTRTYEGFVRRGAKLNRAQKAQLSDTTRQLAIGLLRVQFASCWPTKRPSRRRARLTWPAFQQDVKDAAAGVAKAKGLPAGTYAIRNTRSAVEPVLTLRHQPRAAREGVDARSSTAATMAMPTTPTRSIAKIVKLRADRAKLLGYARPRRLADAGHDGQVARPGRWT